MSAPTRTAAVELLKQSHKNIEQFFEIIKAFNFSRYYRHVERLADVQHDFGNLRPRLSYLPTYTNNADGNLCLQCSFSSEDMFSAYVLSNFDRYEVVVFIQDIEAPIRVNSPKELEHVFLLWQLWVSDYIDFPHYMFPHSAKAV